MKIIKRLLIALMVSSMFVGCSGESSTQEPAEVKVAETTAVEPEPSEKEIEEPVVTEEPVAEEPIAEEPVVEVTIVETAEVATETTLEPINIVVKGFGGDMNVLTTFTADGKIEAVTIGDNNETAGIGTPAIEKLPAKIVESQSINVDGITGATFTSKAILEGVSKAITEAGFDINNYSQEIASTAEVYMSPLAQDPTPSTWDMSYDVVVVGSGFAGLAAADAADLSGATTVVLEQMASTGGQSKINGGQYAAYTSSIAQELQEKLNLTPDTAEAHVNDTIVGGGNLPIKELVEVFVKGAPVMLDLFIENGLNLKDTLAMPGGHTGYRTYVTENMTGSDIVNVQIDMAENDGIEILTEHKVVQLFTDENEKVVGVQVATNDGLKTIEAKNGVVLATGGFSSNVDMRTQYNEALTEEMPTTNNPSSTGDGLKMAVGLGAGTVDMEWIQLYPFAEPGSGILDTAALISFTGPSYGVVYVDINGNRYVNEGATRDECSQAALDTGATTTFGIFNRNVTSWLTDEEINQMIDAGRVFMAETWEELVKQINAQEYDGATINMDATTLEKTIIEHNGFIDAGKDTQFGKDIKATHGKIEAGPYYAVPQWPAVHHTMGGVTINSNAQVLNANGDIIEGLYAAGEVTGGIHGTNRLGSNAVSDAVSFGYVAGTHAITGENPFVD